MGKLNWTLVPLVGRYVAIGFEKMSRIYFEQPGSATTTMTRGGVRATASDTVALLAILMRPFILLANY